MNFTVERTRLLRSLARVQSVAEKRETFPVLANVLLTAKQGELSLAATDTEIEVVDAVAANVVRPGIITAPAHILYDLVRKLPDDSTIEFNSPNDSTVSIKAGRSRFNLGCLPVDDFPNLSGDELPYSFGISPQDLASLIDRTCAAMSNEETRYYLNGIYIHFLDGNLVAVATDGHRLSIARVGMVGMGGNVPNMPGIIIPRTTIHEIRKLIANSSGLAMITASENKIRISHGSTALTSKLIDGSYPDYQRVIPSNNENMVIANTSDLARAIDRVASVSSDKTSSVKLSVENGSICVESGKISENTAMESVDAEYNGPKIEIGFNAKYFSEISRQIAGDKIMIMIHDECSPIIIKDTGDSTSLFILMPTKI